MVRALIDTNILIDFLRGVPEANRELDRYESPLISLITWIEVMAGTTAETEIAARAFLATFELVEIDARIAESAVQIRKAKRLKLPDALIAATAQVHQCLLVTRNLRDFDPAEPGVRMPYTV